jgi:uncharacterized protein (TIGR01777 family)
MMETVRKRVVIAGGSGFIGRALAGELVSRGYDVAILTRSPASAAAATATAAAAGCGFADAAARVRDVHWDGKTLGAWTSEIDGAHAVVNLAGKNVNCRYTPRALHEIDQSRVDAVTVMASAINRCANPPRVLVQASTTAIYGDRHDEWLDDSSPPGTGVPVSTATGWENAFNAPTAQTPHTRRVHLRISFALGPTGGVLRTLSTLTKLFLGGAVSHGNQYISWIHITDLNRIFVRAIEDESMQGLYNATSPNPVTNKEFMRELRRAHHRPWSPPTPAWAVHIGCFFMRTEPVLALTGRRVTPKRLIGEGFAFAFTELAAALNDVIHQPPRTPSMPR